MSEGPQISRVRHELKRRTLSVARVERLPPNMVRVVLHGEELRGFTSLGFDDHIKLMFAGDAPAMRDFTPRRYDSRAGELWVDFFLHEGGPAAAWASQATAGQTLQIGGPKGSAIIALDGIDVHMLIGDETALPAIARRLEELPPTARVIVVVETDATHGRPALAGPTDTEIVWVERDGLAGPPAHAMIDALRRLSIPQDRCFVWVAVESQAARAIRNYLRTERGLDKRWIKAAGYWQRGVAGAHDKIADEE